MLSKFPKKQTNKNYKTIFICLLLLCLAGGLLWGCDTGPALTPPVTAPAEATPGANAPLPPTGITIVGTPPAMPPLPVPVQGGPQAPVTVGDWTFSALSLKVYQFMPGPKPGAAVITPTLGVFVAAVFTVKNNGSAAGQLALSDFELTDGAGHKYAPHAAANAAYSGSKKALSAVDAPVPPGESHLLGIVFDVPPTAGSLTLTMLGQGHFDLGAIHP